MPMIEYILFVLVLGAYGFAWACYTKLSREVEFFFTNHLVHEKKEREKLEAKVDMFIEAYNKSKQS